MDLDLSRVGRLRRSATRLQAPARCSRGGRGSSTSTKRRAPSACARSARRRRLTTATSARSCAACLMRILHSSVTAAPSRAPSQQAFSLLALHPLKSAAAGHQPKRGLCMALSSKHLRHHVCEAARAERQKESCAQKHCSELCRVGTQAAAWHGTLKRCLTGSRHAHAHPWVLDCTDC